ISLSETGSGKVLSRLSFNPGTPARVAFSPDGRKLLCFGTGGVRLLDAVGGRLLLGKPLTPNGSVEAVTISSVEAVAISPDGHTILAGISQPYQKEGEATLWDASTGQLLRTFIPF